MKESEMKQIASLISRAVRDETGANTSDVAAEVTALVERFPAYPH
jgi:glycine/serine hydroxymethyltransferase